MNNEIEAKFLDISKEVIRLNLRKASGQLVLVETLMKRTLYNFPDRRLDAQSSWVRVRNESDRTTLSFKKRDGETIDGMKEWRD